MSLFDGTPLTVEQILQNQAMGPGETIRKLSAGGKWHTMRHKPWYLFEGAGPAGASCASCHFLVSTGNAGKFKKCGKQKMTHGTGTDIRAKDLACALYKDELIDGSTGAAKRLREAKNIDMKYHNMVSGKHLSRRQYMKVSAGTMAAVAIVHLIVSLNLLQEVA